MKFEPAKMETTILPNFKGGNKKLVTKQYEDKNVKILMNSVLEPGASIGLHTHQGSLEVIYIISGTGTAICEGETENLYTGDVHYCPDGATHTLVNTGRDDLIFIGIIPQLKKAD